MSRSKKTIQMVSVCLDENQSRQADNLFLAWRETYNLWLLLAALWSQWGNPGKSSGTPSVPKSGSFLKIRPITQLN